MFDGLRGIFVAQNLEFNCGQIRVDLVRLWFNVVKCGLLWFIVVIVVCDVVKYD